MNDIKDVNGNVFRIGCLVKGKCPYNGSNIEVEVVKLLDKGIVTYCINQPTRWKIIMIRLRSLVVAVLKSLKELMWK